MGSSKQPRHRSLDKVAVSKSDGSLWRPSYPDGYTQGHAMADVLLCRSSFYFRKVRRVRRRIFCDYWEDTGDVWQPSSGEFDVVPNGVAIEIDTYQVQSDDN